MNHENERLVKSIDENGRYLTIEGDYVVIKTYNPTYETETGYKGEIVFDYMSFSTLDKVITERGKGNLFDSFLDYSTVTSIQIDDELFPKYIANMKELNTLCFTDEDLLSKYLFDFNERYKNLHENEDMHYLYFKGSDMILSYFNPDSEAGGQIVNINLDFPSIYKYKQSEHDYESLLEFIEDTSKMHFVDINHYDFMAASDFNSFDCIHKTTDVHDLQKLLKELAYLVNVHEESKANQVQPSAQLDIE